MGYSAICHRSCDWKGDRSSDGAVLVRLSAEGGWRLAKGGSNVHPCWQRGAVYPTVLNGQSSRGYVQFLQIPINATFAAWNYSIRREGEAWK